IVNANANYNFTGIWTDTSEDWQTITARFDSIPAGTMQCVQFQLYKESWNPVAGLEIYIDDIELIKNAGTNQSEVLNMIKVNDADIEFFEQDTLNYVYNLPYTHDPANIPTVDYTPGIDGQNVTLTPAVNLSGSEAERTASLSIMQDQAVVTQYKILFNILPPLDIYICLGQSNMSGYGEITETDKGVIANTYLLTPSEKFEAATNPLNRYSTISNGTYARISPAYGFAQALAGKTENPLGLLVNARNGSSIADWGKANANNTNLYANTLNRAIAARDWGIIKGIIWHQGESDSWQASAYMNLLKTWVNNFRNDMGDTNSEIYFVAGELAYWRQNGTGSTDFNNVIHDIASNIPNSDWVSAAGLTPYLDETDPHFSRESAITLGERYAEKIIGKFYGTPTALDDISANDISISAYTLTGRLLTILDANVSRICIYDIYGRNILTQSLQKQTTCTLPAQGWYILSQEYQDKKQICKIYVR
ncbi:MAG: sialate O-acetylesterase, partial [Dysgonamonadaceae bacterium]|nr:sialate O-acetylesterase [Dysgonamonadaceae bacterium]